MLIDLSIESEIKSDKNNITAIVTYKETVADVKVLIISNLSEVHCRFRDTDEVAFESTYHSTGTTLTIGLIESVQLLKTNPNEDLPFWMAFESFE